MKDRCNIAAVSAWIKDAMRLPQLTRNAVHKHCDELRVRRLALCITDRITKKSLECV